MTDEVRPAGEDGKPIDRRHNWFARAFEDKDGIPDEARIMAVTFCLWFMALSTLAVFWTHSFEPVKYGGGAAAVCGGVGGWFWMRGDK